MKSFGGNRHFLPMAYLVLAGLVTVTVLPSSLRPPPEQTSESAGFDPDAPPDEAPDAIIQSLQQAASRTAGASGREESEESQQDTDAGELTTTTTTAAPMPARGQCYGEPPRQLDSVYAPPCRPAFVGDNGGATAPRGVSAEEVRIGLAPDLTGTRTECGEIQTEPTPEEGSATRTYRVLAEYFNKNLELSGRQLRFFYLCNEGQTGEEGQRVKGVKMDEYDVFASIGEYSEATASEAARRGVIHFANIVVVPDEFYEARQPFLYGSRTNATTAVEFGSPYLCKRLHGNQPFPTGDALIDYDAPRTFGILALSNEHTRTAWQDMVRRMKDECGAEAAVVAEYNFGADGAQGIATALAKLRQANVSTVVFMGDIISLPAHAQVADQQRYYPEWYLMGYGGFETAVVLTRGVSPTQWRNAFGFSFEEIPRPPSELDCWRAYRSVDPDNDPSESVCNIFWHSMVFLSGSIQEAGPNLNVDTFRQALFTRFNRPPDPVWSMAGGFGPGDYTYGDYAVELFWDPTGAHPDGQPGAYAYLNCGARFDLSSIPSGNPDAMFQDSPTNVLSGSHAGPGCEAR